VPHLNLVFQYVDEFRWSMTALKRMELGREEVSGVGSVPEY